MEKAVICPLCGNNNECAYISARQPESCWCQRQTFPQALLDKVPADYQGKVCLCKSCLDRFRLSAADA